MRQLMGIVALVVFASGCAGEERGTLTLEIWGEDFIEEGIGAEDFSDGWSVTFDRFLVTLEGLAVSRGDGAPDIDDGAQRVFDLTRPGPSPVLSLEVPAGRYDHTDYSLSPASSEAIAASASAEDLSLMQEGGFAVFVEGRASRGDETETFAWGFDQATSYVACESAAEISGGGAATIQLTIHADHLFYDDLFAEEPALCFDAIAEADADQDGEVTTEELQAYSILTLSNYGTGSERVETLLEFVSFLIGTLGHIDGEGHCEQANH